MATFRLDLVSPEKLVFSGDVEQVDVPGTEGDFGVLAGHAPLVAALRPGLLIVYGKAEAMNVVVQGGFVEVGPETLTVLADSAVLAEDFDVTLLADEIKDAEEDLEDAKDDAARDKLASRLKQLRALKESLSQ